MADEPALDAIRTSFEQWFARDASTGVSRPLTEYQSSYPGFEAEIGRIHALLSERTGCTSGGGEVALDHELPERIGSYRVLERIGVGGMGLVFRAQQERPNRVVAIKVMRRGLAGAEAKRRFVAEAEALGRLQHPGIAQILEAGTWRTATESLPFLAMEFVDGVSITQFAERELLGPEARIELLIRVCEAVQHAHERGVIHRDLKPDNVLVDVRGQPKILDFGIARSDRPSETLQTLPGQVMGTLDYMSPEQLAGDNVQIGPTTDVYSLGVLGFELLTGTKLRNFAGLPLPEIARRALVPVDRPLASVRSEYRGDLDTILGKALRADIATRYASAAEFGADLDRFLRKEPVSARPTSPWYRARMFSRRHRSLVAGGAATLLALVGGAAVSLSFALDSRARAGELERVVRFQAAQFDRIEPRRMAKAIEHAFNEAAGTDAARSLGASDAVNLARSILLSEIFEPALAAARGEFADQPGIRASVLGSIVRSMRRLGMSKPAGKAQVEVLGIQEQVLGEEHPDTIAVAAEVAKLRYELADYRGAAEMWLHVANHRERMDGATAASTIEALGDVGSMVYLDGRIEESYRIHLDCYERSKVGLGAEDERTLGFARAVSDRLADLGRKAEAAEFGQLLVECRRRGLSKTEAALGADHRETIHALFSLAEELVVLRGWNEESLLLYRDAVARARRTYGSDSGSTMALVLKLGEVAQGLRLFDEARACDAEHLSHQRRVAGDRHPETLTCIHNAAMHLVEQRRYREAEALLAECLAGRKAALRGDDWRIADTAKRLEEVREWIRNPPPK